MKPESLCSDRHHNGEKNHNTALLSIHLHRRLEMTLSSIDAIRTTLMHLIECLESKTMDIITPAQSDFSQAVDAAKSLLDQGKIQVEVKGLPAAMHLYATRDLPNLIADKENHPSIIKELNQFRRVMDKVVSPREVD